MLLISYIDIILEATISRFFPTQMYHVVFQLVKNCLYMNVTVVFLMYMDKLVCINSDSDQEVIRG